MHGGLGLAADTAAGSKLANTALQPLFMQAAAAANLSRRLPQLGAQSSKWQPVIFSSCTEGMPQHWAPCMVGAAANPTLAFGEEREWLV